MAVFTSESLNSSFNWIKKCLNKKNVIQSNKKIQEGNVLPLVQRCTALQSFFLVEQESKLIGKLVSKLSYSMYCLLICCIVQTLLLMLNCLNNTICIITHSAAFVLKTEMILQIMWLNEETMKLYKWYLIFPRWTIKQKKYNKTGMHSILAQVFHRREPLAWSILCC